MTHPKPDPKSKLTLSAPRELGRGSACRPDEFPPYEPVPPARVRVLADLTVITNPMAFAGNFALWFTFGLFGAYAIGLLR